MEFRCTRRDAVRGSSALLVGGSLAGCSSDGGGDDDHTVDMTDDFAYVPGTLSVTVGTTVTWENVGTVGHTVTAYEDAIPSGAAYFASGGFDAEQAARNGYPSGGTVPGGETYEHTFETPGTYDYFCIPHEASGMKGTIEVRDS